MLKTRKLISLVLVVAMVLSMGIVGMVSASAADGDYFLVGSMNGWAPADGYQFSENSEAPGEYMLMGVALSEADMIKVKNDTGDGSTGWYPDGMDNHYTVAESGTYNVYFRPDGQGGEDWHNGFFYLELAGSQDPTDPPADPTDPPADPTDPPQDPTDPPADPTDPPADPTDAPTEEPQPTGNDAKITIDGVSYNAHVGDKIHYDYYVNMNGVPTAEGGKPGKITEFEGSLYYDKSKLTLLNDIEGKEDEDTGAMLYENLPNIKSGNVVVANDDPDRLGYNGINLSGYNFSSEKVLLHADFEVKAAGESSITNVINNLGSGEVKVVYVDEVKEQFGTKTTATVECPHGDQTDATQAPTQAPPAGDKAVVTIKDWSGTTATREFKIGDEFSVISYLQVPENKRVNSIDVRQQFNVGDKVVELVKQTVTKTDDDNEEYTEVVPALTPQIKDAVVNVDEETSTIKANGSKAKYNGAYKFPNEDSVLIQAFYKVVANGNTNINTWIETMATITSDDAMENQIMGGEKVGSDTINTKTEFDTEEQPTDAPTTAPETDEPTTAPVTDEPTTAPVTDEPTTAPETDEPTSPPILGSTYYLTGSIAGWGPMAEFELKPTNNADAEEYGISGITLTTDDMIKAIKTNKGGTAAQDWYPDGMDNNITVDHDSTYTILFRPNGDGTAEDGWIYSWKAGEEGYPVGGGTEHWGYLFKIIDEQAGPTTAPVTDEPTTAPETDEPTTAPETDEPTTAPHGLWVVADGKYYAVEPQQEITYIYYLNTGEKVCSLDAETYFDTDGLTLLTDTEEEMDQLFPIIKDAMVLNDLVPGRLKYNYSAAKGKTFDNDDAQLICAKFRVDAEEGVYHIDTYLHTVAGADEHKYIFNDETVDELQRSEGLLDGIEPGPAPVIPTDAPTTAPETDEPTTAPRNLWVVADGKYYAVEPQQEITYVYYLNTGEKVCSLDAETFFDTDGLTLLTDTEEEMDQLFPIIKDAMVLNDLVPGRLKYNYSAAKGKTFDNDDAQLICAKFRVDAEEGVYHIDTFLHTVAGADEHKYIFNDEVLDELKRSEGLLEDLEPSPEPVIPTDAPTTAPETDEPTTAPETDEPTTAPETDEPTTAPETDEPTTAPETDEPTTAPETDEPTVEPTAAPITYEFEENPYVYDAAKGGQLIMVVHNTDEALDENTFDNFDKLVINGVDVTANFAKGSLQITIQEANISKYFHNGDNTVEAYFVDAEAPATTIVQVTGLAEDETKADDSTNAPSPAENGKSTSDESGSVVNSSAVQTGSTEMAIIFLVILVMAAGIVIYTKKRKVD